MAVFGSARATAVRRLLSLAGRFAGLYRAFWTTAEVPPISTVGPPTSCARRVHERYFDDAVADQPLLATTGVTILNDTQRSRL